MCVQNLKLPVHSEKLGAGGCSLPAEIDGETSVRGIVRRKMCGEYVQGEMSYSMFAECAGWSASLRALDSAALYRRVASPTTLVDARVASLLMRSVTFHEWRLLISAHIVINFADENTMK